MESLMVQGAACRCQQFLALCKLRVVSLIVFTAVIGMFLAVPGWPNWNALWAGTLGIALVAGAAAAFNCLIEQKIDAVMARTRARPLPRGELTSTQTLVFSGVVGGRPVSAECVRQPTHDVADTGHVRRLCGDLYSRAETGHAAEHCHWRRVRRDAAGTWLGRGNGRNPSRCALVVPDHFCLDTSAFLGLGAIPARGIRSGPACRCCR